MKRISHWIDGRIVEGTSGNSAPVYDPATGEQSAAVDPASVDEVDRAIAVAEAAAGHAVTAELVEDTSDELLPGVTLSLEPGDPVFDDALANLGWRLFAERLGTDELADLGDLWTTVAEREDTATAWKAVLTVLLRDSRMLST